MAKAALNKCFQILFVLLLAGVVPFAGSAQERYLSRKITLSVTSVRVEEALTSIGKAGHFTFSYNADIIDPDRKVTIHATDRNVNAVLTDLFGESVRRKEVGDHVILVMNTPRREQPKEKTECTVTGVVTDAVTGKVLKDATVYEVGGRRSVLTQTGGQFSITFTDGASLRGLSISKHGYRDTVIFIRPVATKTMLASLSPRAPALERVPVQPGSVSPVVEPVAGLTIDSLALVNVFVPRKLRINSINLHIFDTWPVQFSLVPYLSTNWKVSGSVNSAFSLNLLVGYLGGVRGVEIGGLLNIDRNHVRGAQIGGLGNIVGKRTSGFQAAGLFNIDMGHFYGCQVAGLFNWTSDTLRGATDRGTAQLCPHPLERGPGGRADQHFAGPCYGFPACRIGEHSQRG